MRFPVSIRRPRGGIFSRLVAADSIPPAPSLSCVPGAGKNTLMWSPISGATSYNLYWRKISGVTKLNGTKITGVVSPYEHTPLAGGDTYYYVLTAVNAVGESADSPQVSGAVPGRKYLSINPGFPLREVEKWVCNVKESESGIEFRSSPSQYPVREWDLSWHAAARTTKTELIRDIINYSLSAGQSFFWKEPQLTSRNRIKVGMGTGSKTTYLLPTTSWETQTIRVDGVTTTITVDYTYSLGTGQNGLDQIIFGVAPANGSLIELDYTNGYLITLVYGEFLDETLLPAGYGYYDLDLTLRESKEEWPA